MKPLKIDRSVTYFLCMVLLAGLVSSCRGAAAPGLTLTSVSPPTLTPATPGNTCSSEDITVFLDQTDNLLLQFDDLGALVETTPPDAGFRQ